MRRLLLLRHAKTETDAPSGQDQDRRLDERGHRDAAEIGGWIARHKPLPDLVLVSPAVRAAQTWEIAHEAMKDVRPRPKVEFLPELYGADPAQLLITIRMASAIDPKRLMLVGHNPGMHELALALAGSGDEAAKKALSHNLPTSGLAIIDFATDDWNEVSFRRGKLVQFVSPKLLKQA
ncbi:histidine phosphatase family protein [Bradyrhizobium jicamae]|uniref:Histidine phosphatase family protein n=1 Tax=Bradyrhizobium jicamae TaxID=280332 RepID=A0ABS5FUW3_9BRAD|nr:histidine phosphatase family protein [Bradyrhizobium jicamae]MBR0800562.1 histidine phosphatase family protein [Bradyrhizobium jicamae]MBR0938324.1 histidine phosphatase family protein [Bradyrhizobium jicamae]